VASVGATTYGCFNIHASLLPRWRGAAPIHRAIEAGDTQTGITLMQMDAGLDTGDMLLIERVAMAADDTTGSLHDKLASLGGQLAVRALRMAAAGELRPVAQPSSGITYAHKVDKAEAVIDWSQSADVIGRKIRAFNPFPGASTLLGSDIIKLWRAEPASDCFDSDSKQCTTGERYGTVLHVNEHAITVQTGQGALRLTELQRAGGKRLAAAEFLRGFALEPGQVLG
jgi:methionyl-tRNA formyltransferase